MKRTKSFYDMRDALAEPGCAVCRLKQHTAYWMLDNLLDESVNDPGIREKLRHSRGFCREHTWALERLGSAQGMTIVMHDVLKEALRTLREGHFEATRLFSRVGAQELVDRHKPRAATEEVVAALGPQGACPACAYADEMEGILLDVLVEHLLEKDGLLAPFRASSGLCLPHLRGALQRVNDGKTYDALTAAQEGIWQRLLDNLGEALRKYDYRLQGQATGEEGDSWRRAMGLVAGARVAREAEQLSLEWKLRHQEQKRKIAEGKS